MSIYIKGMEMPKNAYYIDVRLFADGWAHIPTDEPPYYNKAFEVIELPEHGRLIDADAFLAKLKEDPLFPLVEKYGMSGVIEAQPTIIPADGGADIDRIEKP